ADELVPPRDTSLRVEGWQRFVDDYERTLLAWAARFNDGWDQLADHYDEHFRRRWNFYLHGCAAAFRAGLVDVSQIVYTKRGLSNRSGARPADRGERRCG
ncbi:MAG: class I SAM-dependent methyltransferase, partial [Planctomycetota bacterium]